MKYALTGWKHFAATLAAAILCGGCAAKPDAVDPAKRATYFNVVDLQDQLDGFLRIISQKNIKASAVEMGLRELRSEYDSLMRRSNAADWSGPLAEVGAELEKLSAAAKAKDYSKAVDSAKSMLKTLNDIENRMAGR